MRSKSLPILSLLLALVVILALAAPVFAHQSPALADSNNLDIGISRPSLVYHVGDTVQYTVTVSVPLDPPGPGIPAFQSTMNTYFTDPADLVLPDVGPQIHTLDFPVIPQLLPGESVSFNSTVTTCVIYSPQLGDPTRADLTSGTLPMPASPTFITSTTLYPGGTAIVISNFPELDYVIAAPDFVGNPNLIAFARTSNVNGSHSTPGTEDSGAKEVSISTFVSEPNTNVTITPSAALVDAGQSVTLTVTEQNTGNIALTAPVHVVVLKGVSAFDDLVAPPDSGDAGTLGQLDVGETWTWVISSGPLNSAATFQATGHGIEAGTVNDITYTTGYLTERASTTITVNQPNTLATISANPTSLGVGGGNTNLTVTETNNGAVALSNVVMTVTNTFNATTWTLMKVGSSAPAVFVSGDTGNDAILGVGEIWTWSIPGVLVIADTTFIVNGDATYGDPAVHVNYQTGYTTERNNVIVTVRPPQEVPASTDLGLGLMIAVLAGVIAFVSYRRMHRSQT